MRASKVLRPLHTGDRHQPMDGPRLDFLSQMDGLAMKATAQVPRASLSPWACGLGRWLLCVGSPGFFGARGAEIIPRPS